MKKYFTLLLFSFFSLSLYAQLPCQAGFNHFNSQNGTQFYDASLGQPTSWSWNFGDGSSDTARNSLHKYSQPGTYYVCLIISDGATCTDTACDSVTVTTTPGGGGNCTAGFNAYPGGTGNTVTFGNTSFPQTATWLWDFGDGTTDTAMGPTHNFPNPGTYWVCLTMTDSTGCKDTLCDSVVVNSGFPTGQILLSGAASVDVYPVPASGEFFIEYFLSEPSRISLELFSYDGRKISSAESNFNSTGKQTLAWNTRYEPGIYLLKVAINSEVTYRRIIVAR